jgi:DNA polymerase sigma
MYELYHLYDEVALTTEEGKCRSKLIQCREETTHPQPKSKPPRIFSTKNY